MHKGDLSKHDTHHDKENYLIISFEDFKNQLQQKINEASDLLELNQKTTDDLETFRQKIKSWKDECVRILQHSFLLKDNDFVKDFLNANGNVYNVSTAHKELNDMIDREREMLSDKQRVLWYITRITGVSDAIINRESTDFKTRANYSTEEKMNLLLDKLYQIYDNSYYPVKNILEGNGIISNRIDEDKELAEILEGQGYIEKYGTSHNVNVRLNSKGALYVENKRKAYRENYSDIIKSQAEINAIIITITKKLTFLGYQQDLIFKELNEIRDFYSTIDKKNWAQLLKGKLLDLSLAKLIDKDTIDDIYFSLTGHKLQWP